MKYKTMTGLVLIMLAAVSFSAQALDVLSYNPFKQPDMTDEMSRSNTNKIANNEMELRGTVLDGDNSLVNISGKFYRLNQEVSGFHVVRIESASVTLRRGNNEKILTLNDDE